MDKPPRPLILRATQTTRRPAPRPARPFGIALGLFFAGAWALFFIYQVALPGWTAIIPILLGFLAIFVAVILIGVSIGLWLSERHRD